MSKPIRNSTEDEFELRLILSMTQYDIKYASRGIVYRRKLIENLEEIALHLNIPICRARELALGLGYKLP
jgi:hypothetical protein